MDAEAYKVLSPARASAIERKNRIARVPLDIPVLLTMNNCPVSRTYRRLL